MNKKLLGFLPSTVIDIDLVDSNARVYFIDYISQTTCVIRMKTGPIQKEMQFDEMYGAYLIPERIHRDINIRYYYILVELDKDSARETNFPSISRIHVENVDENFIESAEIRNPNLCINADLDAVKKWLRLVPKPRRLESREVSAWQ